MKDSFKADAVLLLLCESLDRLRDLLLKKAAQNTKEFDSIMELNLRQEKVMVVVSVLTMTQTKGISLKKLASRLNMTLPATSLLVDSMVNAGRLLREPDPDDRRALCIKLSPEGHAAFNRICAEAKDMSAELFKDISPEKRAVFAEVVSDIYAKLFQDEK